MNFISKLYKDYVLKADGIDEHIKTTLINKFSKENREILNQDIMIREISQVVKKLKKDKDGLSAIYYKNLAI